VQGVFWKAFFSPCPAFAYNRPGRGKKPMAASHTLKKLPIAYPVQASGRAECRTVTALFAGGGLLAQTRLMPWELSAWGCKGAYSPLRFPWGDGRGVLSIPRGFLRGTCTPARNSTRKLAYRAGALN
jgi:hypothetical protein